MRRRGIDVGLAIKPGTDTRDAMKVAAEASTLLFLAVDPGFYGSPFRAEVLEKIAVARRAFQDKVISVDGGVLLDNSNGSTGTGISNSSIPMRHL